MAVKKVAKALAVRGTTALANWQEEMKKDAQDVASHEKLMAPRISFMSGGISVAGNAVKINMKRERYELPVIVVANTCEKAYYENEEYDAEESATPVCYAFGADEGQLAPGKNGSPPVPKPQAETCAICPHNVMGTSSKGEGKRCKDRRRLMVISADTAPDAVAKTEAFMVGVPATSIYRTPPGTKGQAWVPYVHGLKEMGLPPWGIETTIFTEKFKSYFLIKFEPNPERDDPRIGKELYTAIKAKQASVVQQMMAPYPVITAGDKPKTKQDKKAAKVKAKKRAAKVS